jgi:hypothetical protein
MSFLSCLLARIASESPAFHKKLMKWALIVGVLLVAATWFLDEAPMEMDIPHRDFLKRFCKTLTGVAAGVTIGASASTANPKLIDAKVKERLSEVNTTPEN